MASASEGEPQLIMPQRVQVIPLDVLEEGVRTARRRSRQKARTVHESTAESGKQAKTQGNSEQIIQPLTVLLYLSVLAMQQEHAEAKLLMQQVTSEQIIQPVTALLFMAVLTKQQQNAADASGDHHKQGCTSVHMAATQSSTPKSTTPAPVSPQAWVIRLQKWQVGLGCLLCQAILGIVLVRLSLDPFGLSAFLVPPAILYLLYHWLDSSVRKEPFANLFVVNCVVGITALVFYLINSLTP
jgi:hypothetical protein